MQYNPHDYQVYAKEQVIERTELFGAFGLFLSMGLGKTVIVLTAIWELLFDYFQVSRVLYIAPLRVAKDTIPLEVEKWDHLKGLTYSVVVGTEKQRREALSKRAFLYIINRENVVWLIENGYFNFDCVVIDELSSFKSHQSKRFKALRKVRSKVRRVIGMTGTPCGNGLLDLWAEVNLLDMGQRLGRYIGGYRERYFMPDKRNREVIFSYKPKEGAEKAIYEAISDICISMKADDHLILPECIISNVEVRMSDDEMQKYEQLKKDLVLSLPDGEIDAGSAVALSNKLHQMADGVVYADDGKPVVLHDRKMEALEELIEEAQGENVLIVYWFKTDRQRIIDRFGAVPLDNSDAIKAWCDGKVSIGLISPMSAAYGLNLQSGGHHMIWYSNCFSLELTSQCNARLFRQGQENTVVVQRLVTKDTIDEDILAALDKKDCTQEALLAAIKARIGGKDDRKGHI